jgi:hypothetical protein
MSQSIKDILDYFREEAENNRYLGDRRVHFDQRHWLRKDSQIINDPNDWGREHDDPQYILKLLKSIITVSLDTVKIVNGLPPLNERKT